MQSKQRIQIETGARLHFGLLDTVTPFGGLGVMIDRPATVIELKTAESFSAEPSIQDRTSAIIQRLCHACHIQSLPGVAIRVLQSAPAHNGFGSGTQLSLAIADGLRQWFDADLSNEKLAVEIADRGKRSAVGVHGFFHGGLIFEASETGCEDLNPIQRRVELPETWRLVLLRPTSPQPVISGDQEKTKFARLPPGRGAGDDLRKSIQNEILPSAEAGDFAVFSKAIENYNRASGMLFADVQGGPYNGTMVTELIAALKTRGASGVGQSSWGPGVFTWCENDDSARSIAKEFECPELESQIAKVKHDGRRIEMI